ncbi:NAD(P)-dependent oxidoreductase [Microbacterium sp. NPDC055357]
MSPVVLLATEYLDGDAAVDAIEAVGPGVRVVREHYREDTSRRLARSADRAAGAGPKLSPAQLTAFAEADVLVALDVPEALAIRAPRLRWCHLISSGTSHLTGAGLPIAGVAVTHSPGVNAEGVAEFAIARIMEHTKRLPELADAQRRRDSSLRFGRRVAGMRLCVVGFGGIGRAVATRAVALGMLVIAAVRRDVAPLDGVATTTDLRSAMAGADAVVICASDHRENTGLVGWSEIEGMAPGAILVNVARGALLDEDAVAEALISGTLGAAALDVTIEEPLPSSSALWTAPNARLSFHSAPTQDGMLERRLSHFCANLHRALHGEPLRDTVIGASSTSQPELT